ncbi:diphosphomevalonate decarboxylase isoform X1 [Hydra vulgaris]|nr:diphosphomevalonate decarboxylase isoform X1 [Hydra vulgaris]
MKPNYFISLRVCSQEVLKNVSMLQKNISDQNSDYDPGFVDPRTAHLTLGVMGLKTCDFANVFSAMENVTTKVKEIITGDEILHFDGLANFGGEVLYLSVKKDDSYQRLLSLVEIFKTTFVQYNVPWNDEVFTPHVTVWKLSKNFSYFKKKKIKKIPKDLISISLNSYFGFQKIDQISLCSINHSKEQDGYYKVIAFIDLKTGDFTNNKLESFLKVAALAPVNIAVIKYWGKRSEELNLPLNSSISVTLHSDDLCTKTEITLGDGEDDIICLNGIEESVSKNPRLKRCLKIVREHSKKFCSKEEKSKKCKIVSTNNFPTGAGLASSASGYACLAKCLGTVYDAYIDHSIIARLGSGSACRSMYGGFVKWQKGELSDGTDSIAVQVASENHWHGLRVLILVVSSQEKSISSTEGMRRSVKSSPFLQYRVEQCVDERLKLMEEAIQSQNFELFAEITMKESNQLHAVCQDTYPPIIYMNSISHEIVQLITAFNDQKIKAAYTFDAGPNAVLFTLEEYYDELLATLLNYFPPTNSNLENYINHTSSYIHSLTGKEKMFDGIQPHSSALIKIISTKPGPGAHLVSN